MNIHYIAKLEIPFIRYLPQKDQKIILSQHHKGLRPGGVGFNCLFAA
jgi:hypothetical protein